MKLLDFNLHEFCRITWASRELAEQWEDKFKHLSSYCRNHLPIFWTKVYNGLVLNIYPHEMAKLHSQFGSNFEILEFEPTLLQQCLPGYIPDDHKIAVLCGGENFLTRMREQLQLFANNTRLLSDPDALADLYTLMGMPACCSRYNAHLKCAGIQDSLWLVSEADLCHDKQHVHEIDGHFATNRALAVLGITLTWHHPCNAHCERSITLANRVLEAMVKSGAQLELSDRLQEVLSWSYAWSSLHGIAEVKSPLFKMIYNTQALAEKYQVNWRGVCKPNTGLYGLSFPYDIPARLIVTDSPSFARGLSHASQQEAQAYDTSGN